jgi:hypothetical protein
LFNQTKDISIGWTSSTHGESGKYTQHYSRNPELSRTGGGDKYRGDNYVKIYNKEEFLMVGCVCQA